jgi:hypothetical protein
VAGSSVLLPEMFVATVSCLTFLFLDVSLFEDFSSVKNALGFLGTVGKLAGKAGLEEDPLRIVWELLEEGFD